MQQKMMQWAAGLMMSAALVSCGNANYKKTASGITYVVHKTGGKEAVKPGSFLKVHYKAMIEDSVLFSTYEHIPAYGRYDSSAKNVHDFVDFLSEMNVGDSALYIRSVDSMMKKGYLVYNDVFKQGGTVKGTIVVLATFPDEASMNADVDKENEKERLRQVVGLEKYLKEQKLEGFAKTENGVFVRIDQEGTGPVVSKGDKVKVNYTGQLKNGNKFDSNVDPAFNHVQPFEFIVGTGSVIKGWDEAILKFRQGSKGRIYVPAMMGYGSQSQGDKMPSYSDLVFDIEVLEVQPQAAVPVAPGQTASPK